MGMQRCKVGEGMLMGMQRCLLVATAAATLCPAAIASLPKGPPNTLQILAAELQPWGEALFRLPMVLLSTASSAVRVSGEAALPLAAACVFTCHNMQQQLLGWGRVSAEQGTTPTLAWLWQDWASSTSGQELPKGTPTDSWERGRVGAFRTLIDQVDGPIAAAALSLTGVLTQQLLWHAHKQQLPVQPLVPPGTGVAHAVLGCNQQQRQ